MCTLDISNSFENFSPDIFIDAVEEFLSQKMSGFSNPFNSYINRVYELQALNGERVVAKFYRPGRWSKNAIQDEHNFVLECKDEEIPVISPIKNIKGETIGEINGTFFSVFPKKFGRYFEPCCNEDWTRIGSILGRLHNVGARQKAKNRVILHPSKSTNKDLKYLLKNEIIPKRFLKEFTMLSEEATYKTSQQFKEKDLIRVHGDCHIGNILSREPEGLMLIDFDDMAMGPPVQDIWLILPGNISSSKNEIKMLLKGYRQLREFNNADLKLIESLRIMRMIYFLAWCAKQKNDYKFKHNFPEWGTDSFWRKEINELHVQLKEI